MTDNTAQTKQPTRPLPSLDEPDTASFWRATNSHEFRYQQCRDCSCVVWHPRAHCTNCGGRDLQWQVSAGKGAVYSYSIVRQSYHPFFRNQAPYVVAFVDLDEGPRFLTNLVGVDDVDADVMVGQRVELTWEDHDQLAIPLVRPL